HHQNLQTASPNFLLIGYTRGLLRFSALLLLTPQVHDEPPAVPRRRQPGAGSPPLPDAAGERPAMPEGKANHRWQPCWATNDLIRIKCIIERRLTQSRWHVIA